MAGYWSLSRTRGCSASCGGEQWTSRANLNKADNALAAAKFDRALFDSLDATREDATRIGNLRHVATSRATDVRAAKDRLEAREETRVRANGEAEAAEQQWRQASRHALDVDRELANARHRDAAALLRRELCTGEPCPVCEHPVTEHPPPLSTPMLDALEKKLEQVRRAETRARELRDEARAAMAAAVAAVAAEQQNVEEFDQRSNASEVELAKACELLSNRVREVIVFAQERHIEEQLRENYQTALVAKQRHETARTKRDEADEAVRKAEQSAERLETAVTTVMDQLAQHDGGIADLTRQIAEIDEEIRKVTQASDPPEERAQLNCRRDDIGKVVQDSQAAETMAARELAGVVARLEASGETYNKANIDAQRARAEARDAALAAATRASRNH